MTRPKEGYVPRAGDAWSRGGIGARGRPRRARRRSILHPNRLPFHRLRYDPDRVTKCRLILRRVQNESGMAWVHRRRIWRIGGAGGALRVGTHDASAEGTVRTKKTTECSFESLGSLTKGAMGALNIFLQLLHELDDLVVSDGRRTRCRRLG